MSKAKDCRSEEVLERRPRSTVILERGIESEGDLNEYIDAVLLDQNDGTITTAAAANHLRGALARLQAATLRIRLYRLQGVASSVSLFLPKEKEQPPHHNGNGNAKAHR